MQSMVLYPMMLMHALLAPLVTTQSLRMVRVVWVFLLAQDAPAAIMAHL